MSGKILQSSQRTPQDSFIPGEEKGLPKRYTQVLCWVMLLLCQYVVSTRQSEGWDTFLVLRPGQGLLLPPHSVQKMEPSLSLTFLTPV